MRVGLCRCSAAAARRREQKAFEDNVETQLTVASTCIYTHHTLTSPWGFLHPHPLDPLPLAYPVPPVLLCVVCVVQWLQLCVHGVASLRGSEGAPVLEGYLLSSRGAQLCHLLCTHAVALHLGHDEAAVAKYRLIEGGHELRPTISLDTRNYLKQALPKPVRPSRLKHTTQGGGWKPIDCVWLWSGGGCVGVAVGLGVPGH